MLRRFANLCVLLLSLSGLIPAAAACAFAAGSTDCCPAGQACELEGTLAVMTSAGASCCIAQPAPGPSGLAVTGQSHSRFADSPAPDTAVPASDFQSLLPSSPEPTITGVAVAIKIDQQQIYLRTGRLRL